MFALKKIIGHLLMPLPLGLGLITLGLLLLVLRRRVRGWFALLLGWLVLAIASNRAVSIAITSSLEKTYDPAPSFLAVVPLAPAAAEVSVEATGRENSAPEAPGNTPPTSAPLIRIEAPAPDDSSAPPAPPASAHRADLLRSVGFVAVLGGGHGDAPALSAGQRLSPSARARLIEGVRLALALPETWLVVSGPRNDPYHPQPTDSTHARVLADTAVELGFPRERIVEIDTARDTAEEVAAIRMLAGDERVALVTSAWHLPRAMKLAAAARLDAFPCPADYLGGRDNHIDRLAYVTWDGDSLINTTRAWREYVGQGWAAIAAWWRK